jgi:hypothetical protein
VIETSMEATPVHDDDLAYYRRRALQETEAAAATASIEAAISHRQLASRYEEELRNRQRPRPKLTIRTS